MAASLRLLLLLLKKMHPPIVLFLVHFTVKKKWKDF